MMGVPGNFIVNPKDVDKRYNEQQNICEQTNSWKSVSPLNFLKEHKLKHLTQEEHQVEVTQDFNQDESIVDYVHTILVFVFHIIYLFKC